VLHHSFDWENISTQKSVIKDIIPIRSKLSQAIGRRFHREHIINSLKFEHI
jgi:hypothetical protein